MFKKNTEFKEIILFISILTSLIFIIFLCTFFSLFKFKPAIGLLSLISFWAYLLLIPWKTYSKENLNKLKKPWRIMEEENNMLKKKIVALLYISTIVFIIFISLKYLTLTFSETIVIKGVNATREIKTIGLERNLMSAISLFTGILNDVFTTFVLIITLDLAMKTNFDSFH